MNTFDHHYQHFKNFEDKLIAWKPDFVVPVAKKGCKLLKASNRFGKISPALIKYRTYFELNNVNLKGKKISIVDDATQYTSTLQEYRTYFENLGAQVRTFSFIGHENLYEGKRWKYDEKAEIEIFLPDAVYQEYILQQSYFLLENGNQYDLDHLIFEITLPKNQFDTFQSKLKTIGLLLHLEDYFLMEKTKRFSLINPSFFNKLPFFSDESVDIGPISKIKFIYNPESEKLYFSPIVFPVWDYRNSKLKQTSFADVPFNLPFAIPSTFDSKNKATLFRVYYNLQFTYVGGLAKAFIQQLSTFNLCSSLKIKRDDLDAILGVEEASKFIKSLEKYVCYSEKHEFVGEVDRKEQTVAKRNRYKSFGEVIDYMKTTYENLCRREKKRIGVHYYLSYEKLFSRFQDKISLAENLDYYCDFGVVVPETIIENGKVQRGCRTGEPNSEYNWTRTQVIIPLVIEQFKQEFKKGAIEPMLLNKLLSNFTYDYPSDYHHELHCLIGEPYTFGTLVRAYHHHRASSKPSIYSSKAISPYYVWEKDKKNFFSVNIPEVTKKIRYLFDERQEISYSEIVTYFKLLLKIYKRYERVDVLNMLSICREENYFYSHVFYNIRTWIENYGNHIDESDLKEKNKLLHESGTQANSSWDKIKLAEDLKSTSDEIKSAFGNDLDFIKALEKILKNQIAFSNKFQVTFNSLKQIISLELILTNLSLNYYKPQPKYKARLIELDAINILAKRTVTIPNDFVIPSEEEYLKIAKRIFAGIKQLVDALPHEEPLLLGRLKNQEYSRARNIATDYVYKEELSEATILFMDFSGLRTVPEPKETVISEYYKIAENNARNRSGVKLYGGKGGDDAFSFIFHDIAPAIECAKDIKREFASNMFLATHGDIKFGICTTKLSDEKKENEIIQCWGTAKDCCEFKGVVLRNRGHLIVSQETIDVLSEKDTSSQLSSFSKVENETLKNPNLSAIYIYSNIEPIR